MIRKRIWSLFLVIIFLQACRKDIPPLPENPILTGSEDGVYITNEGNFQFGNAAVSYYEEGLANAVPDLFEPTNNRPLGDVCQSMCFFNGLRNIPKTAVRMGFLLAAKSISPRNADPRRRAI